MEIYDLLKARREPFLPGLVDRVSTAVGTSIGVDFYHRVSICFLASGYTPEIRIAIEEGGTDVSIRTLNVYGEAAARFMNWFDTSVQEWLSSANRYRVATRRPYSIRIVYNSKAARAFHCGNVSVSYADSRNIPALAALIAADLVHVDQPEFPFPNAIHLI